MPEYDENHQFKKNQVLQALVKDKVEEWSERKKGAACFVVFCFFLKVF